MDNKVSGGASNKLHQSKEKIVKNLSEADVKLLKDYGKELKDTNRNKWGETEHGSMRRVAVIPMDVMLAIEKVDPEVFKSKKKLERFLAEFPLFRAADKV